MSLAWRRVDRGRGQGLVEGIEEKQCLLQRALNNARIPLDAPMHLDSAFEGHRGLHQRNLYAYIR